MADMIRKTAKEALEKVRHSSYRDNPERLIDEYVMELSRQLIFKCTDVVRDATKAEKNTEVAIALKGVAVDILDHFGL